MCVDKSKTFLLVDSLSSGQINTPNWVIDLPRILQSDKSLRRYIISSFWFWLKGIQKLIVMNVFDVGSFSCLDFIDISLLYSWLTKVFSTCSSSWSEELFPVPINLFIPIFYLIKCIPGEGYVVFLHFLFGDVKRRQLMVVGALKCFDHFGI